MGADAAINKFVGSVTSFWLDSTKRWQAVRQKVNANTPYTADDLTTDVANFVVKASDMWWSFAPSTANPLLPTAYIVAKVGVANKVSASVYLDELVPPMPVPVVSSIGKIGANAEFQVTSATAQAADPTTLEIVIDYPAPAQGAEGLYQGLVTVGEKPLAIILITVV